MAQPRTQTRISRRPQPVHAVQALAESARPVAAACTSTARGSRSCRAHMAQADFVVTPHPSPAWQCPWHSRVPRPASRGGRSLFMHFRHTQKTRVQFRRHAPPPQAGAGLAPHTWLRLTLWSPLTPHQPGSAHGTAAYPDPHLAAATAYTCTEDTGRQRESSSGGMHLHCRREQVVLRTHGPG